MILNTPKSLSITYTHKKEITSVPISIKGDDIEEKATAKLLGVTFDNHYAICIAILSFQTQDLVSMLSSS